MFEGPVLFFHEVGEKEGGGLYSVRITLETPAEQWTRIAPVLIYFSTM